MIDNIIQLYLFLQFVFLYIYYCIFPYVIIEKIITEETLKKYDDL